MDRYNTHNIVPHKCLHCFSIIKYCGIRIQVSGCKKPCPRTRRGYLLSLPETGGFFYYYYFVKKSSGVFFLGWFNFRMAIASKAFIM